MTKGSYTIDEDGAQPSRKDNSFRSFICALLIFLVLCLIVLLAAFSWGSGKQRGVLKNTSDNKNDKQLARKEEHWSEDVEIDDKPKSNKTNEKIIIYVERPKEKEGITQPPKSTTHPPTTRRNQEEENENEIKQVLEENLETNAERDEEEFNNTTKSDDKTKLNDFLETGLNQPSTKEIYSTESTKFDNNHLIVTSKIFQEAISSVLTKTTKVGTTTTETNYVQKQDVKTEQSFITSTKESVATTKTQDDTLSVLTEEEKNSTTIPSTTEIDIMKLEYTTSKQDSQKNIKTKRNNFSTTTTEQVVTNLPEEEQMSTITSTTTIGTNMIKPDNISTEDFQKINITTERNNFSSTDASSSTTTTQKAVPSLLMEVKEIDSTTEINIMESDSITESAEVKTEPQSLLSKTSKLECNNPVCKTASSRILSMMKHSEEPCDDFYEFACGNFYEMQEETSEYQDMKMLDEQLKVIKDEYVDKFRMFYDSCVSYENYFNFRKRMDGLEELLKEVGEFQLNNTPSTYIDFTYLVASLVLRQSMPLFDIGLDVDKKSSNFILQLSLPHQSFLRTSLDDWSGLLLLKKRCLQEQKSNLIGPYIDLTNVYKLYENCQADYSTYLDSIEAVIRELSPFSNLEPQDLINEIKNIRFTIEFEVLNILDTLPPSAEILETFIEKTYEIRRVSDLNKHFPIIEWAKFFTILTGRQIQDNTLIQLYYADYFKNVFTKLAKVDQKKLNNAFLAIYSYDLFINTVVPKEKYNRNAFCTDLSKRLLPDVWSNIAFSSTPLSQLNSDNEKVLSLFDELKKIFCKSLENAEWIDDDTKTAIVQKCNSINLAVFTEPLRSNILSKAYSKINITSNYQANLISLLSNYKRMVYATEETKFSEKTIFSYFLDPLSTKPLASYSVPTIVVPMGLMGKAPTGLPDYLIKTRIGFSLGRQLARHFDPTGIKYQIQLASSAKSSYFEFVNTMRSLMDYSSPRMFHDKNISFALNGSLSLNERIVDNTAFRLIYDSIDFRTDGVILPWISIEYSREKVFFVAAAQELCKKTSVLDFMLQVFEKRHLPAVLRVENVIGNSQQFTSSFSCPEGSAMDLPQKMQFPYIPEEEYEDDLLLQN